MYYINKSQKFILDIVNRLGCISIEQIAQITKENKKLNPDIRELERRRLIIFDGNIVKSLAQQGIEVNMIKCIDLLCYLWNKALRFEKEDFPFSLWIFLSNEESYNLCYIPVGQEILYLTAINRIKNINNVIVILDDKSQLNLLQDINLNIKYCTLNPIKFYKTK